MQNSSQKDKENPTHSRNINLCYSKSIKNTMQKTHTNVTPLEMLMMQ